MTKEELQNMTKEELQNELQAANEEIKLLNKLAPHWIRQNEYGTHWDTCYLDHRPCALYRIAFLEAQIKEQVDWIPVTERLPELRVPTDTDLLWRFSETVLAYPGAAGEVTLATFWGRENELKWHDEVDMLQDTEINPVAWMPLPAPPRTEK